MSNLADVHKRMREAIKTMKYIDESAFKELIMNGQFDEAIAMIDNIKVPEPVSESDTNGPKPKRKYTKKQKSE